jgi:penicillin-binding protein activator
MRREEKLNMKRFTELGFCSLMSLAVVFAGGCSAFRAGTYDVDLDQPQRHMTATYDYSDMRGNLINSPFLIKQETPPILMIAGVQNRTSDYTDTKALTDRIRTMVLDSGRAQFVNEVRRAELLKEQQYEARNMTPETQIAIGKQLGAKYMLTGSLIEMTSESLRQVRMSRQEVKYYKLTMEITDLETGLIAWTTEEEFARKAKLPLIGW